MFPKPALYVVLGSRQGRAKPTPSATVTSRVAELRHRYSGASLFAETGNLISMSLEPRATQHARVPSLHSISMHRSMYTSWHACVPSPCTIPVCATLIHHPSGPCQHVCAISVYLPHGPMSHPSVPFDVASQCPYVPSESTHAHSGSYATAAADLHSAPTY